MVAVVGINEQSGLIVAELGADLFVHNLRKISMGSVSKLDKTLVRPVKGPTETHRENGHIGNKGRTFQDKPKNFVRENSTEDFFEDNRVCLGQAKIRAEFGIDANAVETVARILLADKHGAIGRRALLVHFSAGALRFQIF